MSTWGPTPGRSPSSVMWVPLLLPLCLLSLRAAAEANCRIKYCALAPIACGTVALHMGLDCQGHSGNFIAKSPAHPFILWFWIPEELFSPLVMQSGWYHWQIHAAWVPVWIVWQVNSWGLACVGKGIAFITWNLSASDIHKYESRIACFWWDLVWYFQHLLTASCCSVRKSGMLCAPSGLKCSVSCDSS